MFTVGQIRRICGDVTTLNWIGPRPGASVERNLGYGPGRLAEGYWVALLVESLEPSDFEFAGTTLRSGGRFGLPAKSAAADRLRPRVHDQILAEYGLSGYIKLQNNTLKSIPMKGPMRIAKVIPVARRNMANSPDQQYPMGAGSLQWTLVKEKNFLIAMYVAPDGTASTPGFSVSLDETQSFLEVYANRARVAQYLAVA